MPPKRTFKDSDDDDDRSSEESTTTEEEEDNDTEEEDEDEETVNVNHRSAVDTSGVVGGQLITNNPNDEAFDVEDDDEEKKTPPQGHLNASGSNAASASLGAGGAVGATAAIPGGGNTLMNNPNDEVFEVDDNQRHVPTPQTDGAAHAHGRIGADGHNAADSNAKVIKNDKHDEFSDVEDDDEDVQTPPRTGDGQLQQQQQQQRQQQQQQPGGVNGANLISNDHHDEAIEIDGSSVETSPERSPEKSTFAKQISPANNASATTVTQQQQQQQVVGGVARGNMKPADSDEDDDDEEVDTSDDDDGNQSGPMMGQITAAAEAAAGAGATGGDQLYRSEDYAYLRDKVDAEVFELFGYIDQFQVSAIELPSKFRPFVPEFIPCVGDIDAFCKVPRPDGLADGLGLHVIDEPSTYQSNPAVVKMNLEYGSKMTVKNQHVESVAEAASRPVLIDRWVAEIKETHAKKPLPSVNYSKPMPDIEELLQVWPAEFEDLLSSDLQFPPPQIDLDIEQYCRVMCTMLDIPIYDNIIESLHVMFTLFLEFRANQHFQHA